jgi:excisionase family DNA binding protein
MLSTGDAAKLFQVSSQTVINWLDQGRLPYDRIGKGPRRIAEVNILQFIKEIGVSEDSLNQQMLQMVTQKAAASDTNQIDPMIILSRDLKILSWNLGAVRLYGYIPSEVSSKGMDLIQTQLKNSHSSFDQAITTTWNDSILNLEVTQKDKNGIGLEVALTISKISLAPDKSEIGYVIVAKK